MRIHVDGTAVVRVPGQTDEDTAMLLQKMNNFKRT